MSRYYYSDMFVLNTIFFPKFYIPYLQDYYGKFGEVLSFNKLNGEHRGKYYPSTSSTMNTVEQFHRRACAGVICIFRVIFQLYGLPVQIC